ncbi:MAG: hypothetical protein DI598_02855 [Pseudopedobacter saltans]|uniref:Uncharacterized protein n=1 Tax=Pseudopedobacter saltans TaxID=151895 RepID=A0A2W5HD29_9SPHI|nr:MAG: hypothetical protein DI598_02855 [Pseudopedobacter saltans]
MKTKIIHITSGDGPMECQRAVVLVMEEFRKEALQQDIKIYDVDATLSTRSDTFVSVAFRIEGRIY